MEQEITYTLITTESGQQVLAQNTVASGITARVSVSVDDDPVASEVKLPIDNPTFLDLQEKTKTNVIDFDTINQEVIVTPKSVTKEELSQNETTENIEESQVEN